MKNQKNVVDKPKLHVVSFSGGKDSTAMLLRMIEEKWPIDMILFCDTGLEFPELMDHVKKVEEYIGMNITVLKNPRGFMYWATEHERVIKSTKIPGLNPGDHAFGYAWPSMFSRWCTKELKTNVIDRFIRDLKKKYEIIQYVGIAADEPEREREILCILSFNGA